MPSKKADYGIDSPILIRNLILTGFILLSLGIILPLFKFSNRLKPELHTVLYSSSFCFVFTAILMYRYSRSGKLRHRDRMIDMISWKGNEKVLDIGTGRGLLMIGAAKKLQDGIATGIDIWEEEDLSGNEIENVRVNVLREGVSHKTVVKHDDARKLSFADNSFDIVLSNLCLHNISESGGRKKACKEIARVLKPGGVAILSDFKNEKEYKSALSKEGLHVNTVGKYWLDTFPPLTIIRAEKRA